MKQGNKNQCNIVMAQLNPQPGCVEENALKVMQAIKKAEKAGADLVVFPELTLMGYPIMDTIDRHPVIVQQNVTWIEEIAKLTGKTHAVIGFVEQRSEKQGKRYYNAAAVVGEGKIKGIVRKCLLPTYSEFNDYRYFEPSKVVGVDNELIEINNVKYAIVICEDGWNDKDFFTNPMYDIDPVKILANQGADVIVNLSASPTRSRKEQLKHNMLSFVAKKYSIPYVYVNQVGAIDDCTFEGASRVYNANGDLIARAKSFEEDFLEVTVLAPCSGNSRYCESDVVFVHSGGRIEPLTKGLDKTLTEMKVFTLDYEPDLERTYKAILQGIRDYFKKNGLKRAVLGLSGGLDSSVSAVLLADALGKENVFGVSMPSKLTSKESHYDAQELAQNLGINFAVAPIKEMVTTIDEQLNPLFEQVEKDWGECKYSKSFVQDNVQARSRATLLWGIANEFCATIPIATSDKSELYMGYATINGDMSGGFAPIADVPKTKLFALARWLNKNREVKNAIPEAVILKPPGAELAINPETGETLTAEEALMPYEFMDEVIWRIENKHESYRDMVDSEFLYERKNGLTKEEKTAWLDKFYRRMSTALYKWSILPPSVIVEGRSINKGDYRQPITSGKINYKEQTAEEIATKLQTLL
jgi:NAD+ synthase (glutamine-hydrolysing)